MKTLLSFLIIAALFYTCSSPTQTTQKVKLFSLEDRDFVKNKYFFVNEYYRDVFESRFNSDLSIFRYDPARALSQVYIWVSELTSIPEGILGVASIDPNYYSKLDFDSIETIEGVVEKGRFKLLPGQNYEVNYERGFFWLNIKLPESALLGISYAQRDGASVGTVLGDSLNIVQCQLIKTRYQQPSHINTWPLMMKNVYDLGDSLNKITNYTLDIKKRNTNNSNTEYDDNRSYLNLFGLDIVDANEDYLEFGDGKFDFNPLLYNRQTGILIFPGVHPFDPLPDSRFQINEQEVVPFYNTSSAIDLFAYSRFTISVFIED